MYSFQGGDEGVGGGPGRFEKVEADLARFEVHVRVADGGFEFYGRRGEGVGGRDGDVEFPEAGCGGGVSVRRVRGLAEREKGEGG